MQREQGQKLHDNIRPSLEAAAARSGWKDWDSLYSAHEQAARVLALHLKTSPQLPANAGPGSMPKDLRDLYEERLAAWVPDHPFLRDGSDVVNAVFEAYLLALGLVGDAGYLGNATSDHLRRRNTKATPLLLEFYRLLSHETEVAARVEHLGFLYDSALAGQPSLTRVEFSLVIDGDPDDFVETIAEAEIVTTAVETGRPLRTLRLPVQADITSSLELCHYIRDATVSVPFEVALGTHGEEYEIGPAVSIECAMLNIRASGLVVTGSDAGSQPAADDASVLLEASSCTSLVLKPPKVRGALQVYWPGSEAYPWTAYSRRKAALSMTREVLAAYTRFRRIALCFRSHSKGRLARFKDKIESQRMLGTTFGPRLLRRLTEDGIIGLEGDFYFWHPEAADRLIGIDWPQLRRGETSPALTTYLEAFVRTIEEA